MTSSRRQFLTVAAIATAAGLTGCSSAGQADDGTAALQFTWWGNDVRNANTTDAIAAYVAAHPAVTIGAQPGEWSSYWDKLATQTAGNTSPDVIQMSTSYISEYGDRGALLDLNAYGIDTTKFTEGTLDSGTIKGTLYGVNAGINTPTILANPSLFDRAGVDLPDDTTWTWEDLKDLSAELTSKLGDDIFGISAFAGAGDTLFSAWLRQRGRELFTADALAFDVTDVEAWLDLMVTYTKTKATPPAARISEDAAKSLDQMDFVVGRTVMANFWSNQVEAVNGASGEEMRILRFPSITGRAVERKTWYHASMQWSASARTEHPEAVVAFINWLTNSTECADIMLAERGIPPNSEVLAAITPQLAKAQQQVSTFITDIQPELAPEPVALPTGGGTLPDVLQRYAMDTLFGRTTPAAAATAFIQEVESNLAT